MHRCHAPVEAWGNDGTIRLTPGEARHLRVVMRVRSGATVAVFDGAGRVATARVEHLASEGVRLRVVSDSKAGDAAGAVQITLIQAVPKGGRLDSVIEKCTEIGVAAIIPVITERCVVRWRLDQPEHRLARWERIAVSAAKQCRTPRLPAIAPPSRLADIPLDVFDACLIGTLAPGRMRLRDAVARIKTRQPFRVAIVIGPEGDLTPGETTALTAAGGVAVTFGDNVLRTDTAAIYAVSVLAYEFQR